MCPNVIARSGRKERKRVLIIKMMHFAQIFTSLNEKVLVTQRITNICALLASYQFDHIQKYSGVLHSNSLQSFQI